MSSISPVSITTRMFNEPGITDQSLPLFGKLRNDITDKDVINLYEEIDRTRELSILCQ
ncbi:MAG: hypothetical protein ACI8RA_002764 [Chlamydiales bacterium]|jgi:hypothetical protein